MPLFCANAAPQKKKTETSHMNLRIENTLLGESMQAYAGWRIFLRARFNFRSAVQPGKPGTTEAGHHPGGQTRWRPASRCRWMWNTVCPYPSGQHCVQFFAKNQ